MINNKNQINNRKLFLDIAKFTAITFMIPVHVFWKLGSDFEQPVEYAINYIFGAFMSAPVFMVAMGVAFGLTKYHDANHFIKRGCNIMMLGYVLNFVRIIPLIVYEVASGKFDLTGFCAELFQGDILQFAGLAMIFFGLLKKYKLSDKMILLIGCIMSIIGTAIQTIPSDSIPLNATLGLFIFVEYPEETIMCFPLFTWFIFPAFGNWFANILQSEENTRKVFKITLLPCLIITLAGSIYEMKHNIFMMSSDANYYHMYINDAFISTCYVVFCFSLLYFISLKIGDKLKHFFIACSDALNLIYLIHWPLVNLFAVIIYRVLQINFSLTNGFAVTLVVALLSVSLGVFAKRIVNEHEKHNTLLH